MRLPAPLLRHNPHCYKNNFGHVLVLAGSPRMLGAAALTCLSAMRAGAGLVTLGVPDSLNLTAQKKISPVIMTWPLQETPEQTLSLKAFAQIERNIARYDVIALGPGLSRNASTQKLILKIISLINKPLVIDADAITALATDLNVLSKNKNLKILTPHAGEMSRLIKCPSSFIEKNRTKITNDFAKRYSCIIILKGSKSVVSSPDGRTYINTTGNVGMATAGSGDVLTGIIAAFLAQKIEGFEAAKTAVFLHGKSGDLAAHRKSKVSLLATDMIDNLTRAFKLNRLQPKRQKA